MSHAPAEPAGCDTAPGHLEQDCARAEADHPPDVDVAETRRQEFNEQANIFARYLPNAIVFGSVTKWARAFSGLDSEVQQSIDWYTGTDLASSFRVSAFFLALAGMASGMGYTLSEPAAPPPPVGGGFSSSGGFGGFCGGGFGGGFAGGGGGGGGGGSW